MKPWPAGHSGLPSINQPLPSQEAGPSRPIPQPPGRATKAPWLSAGSLPSNARSSLGPDATPALQGTAQTGVLPGFEPRFIFDIAPVDIQAELKAYHQRMLADHCAGIPVARHNPSAANPVTGETSVTVAIRQGDDAGLRVWLTLKQFCIENANHADAAAISATLCSENAFNLQGKSPLYVAIEVNRPDIVGSLLALKTVDLNFPEASCQRTPLHLAVAMRNHNIAAMLAKGSRDRVRPGCDPYRNGMDPNSTDSQGETPLHIAARNDDSSMIELLLSIEGIDRDAVNRDGQRPLDLVDRDRSPRSFALLASTPGMPF